MMCQTEKGVTGKELERTMHVTYPTAWRMAKRIRAKRPDNCSWGTKECFELCLKNCLQD